MKTAPLFLSILLQVLPVARVAILGPAALPSTSAVLRAWALRAVVMAGTLDAVSGASAGISGLVKYSGTTPVGSPTFDVAEPAGLPFRYRITVSNPGSDYGKNYFNCTPLPPGLTINTNIGAAGYITGTPSEPGVYLVTLVAGNLNYPIPATAQATITIYLANAPPVITTPPKDQSVLLGSNALFQAEVSGTPLLHYQWQFGLSDVSGATNRFLSLTNVQPGDTGSYRLIVTNEFGMATSTVARLTVREPFLVQLMLDGPKLTNGAFEFVATGPIFTNYVIWQSQDFQNWTPFSTNWVVDGLLRFKDPQAATRPFTFYRASLLP